MTPVRSIARGLVVFCCAGFAVKQGLLLSRVGCFAGFAVARGWMLREVGCCVGLDVAVICSTWCGVLLCEVCCKFCSMLAGLLELVY